MENKKFVNFVTTNMKEVMAQLKSFEEGRITLDYAKTSLQHHGKAQGWCRLKLAEARMTKNMDLDRSM